MYLLWCPQNKNNKKRVVIHAVERRSNTQYNIREELIKKIVIIIIVSGQVCDIKQMF